MPDARTTLPPAITVGIDPDIQSNSSTFRGAPHFRRAVGVDLDRAMLQEARASQPEVECRNVVLIEQKAEEYLARHRPSLDLVTAGRSIHWMDQPLVIRTKPKINATAKNGIHPPAHRDTDNGTILA